MVNLPSKNSDVGVIGLFVNEEYIIYSSMNGMPMYRITAIDSRMTHDGIAGSIARAIREARDIGYEQALADIRKTLGIKE